METLKDTPAMLQVAQIIHELAIIFNKHDITFVEFYDMNIEDKYSFLEKLNHTDFFKVEYLYQLLIDMNFIHGWEI